jgi:methylated-DNA-protein-cysteine methyltransferase related protein
MRLKNLFCYDDEVTVSDSFSIRIIETIKSIPPGRVATYGQIAWLAGNPRGARAVAWTLHSSTAKHDLPWYRVIGSKGRISLPAGGGREEQCALLEAEGVEVKNGVAVDLSRHGWGEK